MPSPFLGALGVVHESPPETAWQFPVKAAPVPSGRHVLPVLTPVPDQLTLGSCVAQTFKKAIEIIDGGQRRFSALATYYFARMMSNLPINQDTGATPDGGVRALKRFGIGSAALEPYDIAKFDVPPSQAYKSQAADHKVISWYRARQVEQAKSALADGHPPGVFFGVPRSFERVAENGLWVDNGGEPVGYHAVLIIGFDDYTSDFIALNWWRVGDWGMLVPGAEHLGRCSFRIPYSAFAPGGRFFDSIVISRYDHEAGR